MGMILNPYAFGGIGGIDANTVLMLHCDGADASTTFADSSSTAKTVTANGNAQVDTADSKFGGASLLLDGSGDYLVVTDHADFTWAGQFTIDFWIKTSSSNQEGGFYRRVIDMQGTAELTLLFYNGSADSTNLGVYSGGMLITGNIAVADGNWNHVALTRDGSNNLRLFVNGVQSGSTLASHTTSYNPTTIHIGHYNAGGGAINGWMDEIRFSNTARWTANFTPPAAAYSA